jgi:glycosyltransferase involved in cell wall biosynthesis
MSERPLVSGFMPAYNAEEFLVEAVGSMLAQDYTPFECVVVDDGSTDSTPEILGRYPQLKVVRQDNTGRSGACNTAIAHTHGEFLTAFDADDRYPANRVSLQAQYLIDNPDVGCVLGRQEWINPPVWLGRDPVFGDLDGIPIGSGMFRRDVVERLGLYDPTFLHGEDMDLMVRMREQGIRFEILPEVIWYRRYHDGQMTANAPEVPPLLRSIRAKLERQRAAAGDPS